MRLLHPDRPGKTVRLGYCLNVHAAETLAGVCAGLRDVTAPVARSLAGDAVFGIGPWFASDVVHELLEEGAGLGQLEAQLIEQRLQPFTYNAFPFGGFHASGLKQAVFHPTWLDQDRAGFTAAVAIIATRLASVARALGEAPCAHVSISTHCGGFGTDIADEAARIGVARSLASVATVLATLEVTSGVRVVLSLEPEPRSSANDCSALPAIFERASRFASADILQRHLGSCLDTCHAAVEFEDPAQAFRAATADGHPLGKMQFSSALSLMNPGEGPGLERLFAMDEPVFLHQVTGRLPGEGPDRLLGVSDIPELRQAWEAGDAAWRDCDELRCHFHVPVDLDRVGLGLGTTRTTAEALLDLALDQPERWGSDELHIEVETYTWDILPPEARGEGGLVGG
ncbi:MAG: hypothetical protein ACI8QS_002609, partial [Planctomycetota bacterium]